MTTLTYPTAAPITGAAPAGLNEAQARAVRRLQTARAAMAYLEPLDPEWLRAEAYYEQLKEDH